jgi:pyridoxamine 5'-phosphate oxidase
MHRIEYERGRLRRDDLQADPVQQFLKWYGEAKEAGHRDPSAMTLATVGADGKPHARMVLLKAVDSRGFVFCTHRDSPKGRDLQANPYAALVFYWARSERQVRVEGVARWLSKEENAAFFSARPPGAQLAASLGHQSEVIQSREALEDLYANKEAEFSEEQVPPLESWGGFGLEPTAIEFWQGGVHRLHDRFRYTLVNGAWQIVRLMP